MNHPKNGFLVNTVGEAEREIRSRRWNAVEALGVAALVLFLAWPVVMGWGILGGNRWVREHGIVPLYLVLGYVLFISPILHGDTAESWGVGNPRRLWRMLRVGPLWRRTALALSLLLIFLGLTLLFFYNWNHLVRVLRLSRSAVHWPSTASGTLGVLLIGGALALFLASCAIRYDNFGPAFRAALKVSAVLVIFGAAAAIAHRGWTVLEKLRSPSYLLGVAGYFFWGYFQQLVFCAWFGGRLRKAFGLANSPPIAPKPRSRVPISLLGGALAVVLLATPAWLTVRALHGASEASWPLASWFALFAFPIGAVWGWFYCVDRKRLMVATLSASFFGLIHIDSYGLVLATWMMGVFLAWLFMEDRTRNIAALGLIHGFLGTTFNLFFGRAEAGALHVSYKVGPWNVKSPGPETLIVPLLCLAAYLGLVIWSWCRLGDRARGTSEATVNHARA